LKFVSGMVPSNSQPVVKTLHWQLDVFADLQLQNCQTAFTGNAQDVDHAAVAAEKRRDMRINEARVKPGVDHSNILQEQAFEPALRAWSAFWISWSRTGVLLRHDLCNQRFQAGPITFASSQAHGTQSKGQSRAASELQPCHFETPNTKQNIVVAGTVAADVLGCEAHDPSNELSIMAGF